MTVAHKPVLLKETIAALAVQPGGRYIDCTLGSGGHALAILDASAPGGQLLGIDADPGAIHNASQRLSQYLDSILLINDNFVNLDRICGETRFCPVHGILFDLGLSSPQLDNDPRGFSFQYDAALDMRFDPRQEISAADIVNTSSEAELAIILDEYGEERFARRIAHNIIRNRPVNTTSHLVRLVEEAVGGRHGRIHPATRTFQALRIAVNRELENLEIALTNAVDALGPGGRLVVISYHSLEDRIVKHFMIRESKDCICPPNIPVCQCGHEAQLKQITKKIIVPTLEETSENPRSRSARMRVAEKIGWRPADSSVSIRTQEKRFSSN